MVRKPILLIFIMTFILLLSSCGEVSSPAVTVISPVVTVKPPQESQEDGAMDKYRELKANNASPAEIIKFAKDNIDNLEKADADTVIKDLIEAQRLKFKNYEDKLLTEDFNVKINSYGLEDLKALNNIKDEDMKSYLQDAFNDGFKLFEAEGMKDLEIDYESTDRNFSGYLSEELSAYIGILAEQSKKHYLADAALNIGYDELADRIIKTEEFLKKFPASEYHKEMDDLHNQYMSTYLLGANNTLAFDMETLEIKPDLLKSFETSKVQYPDSALAGVLTEYMQLLEKNGNKRSKEILQYVGKITGNPEYGTVE